MRASMGNPAFSIYAAPKEVSSRSVLRRLASKFSKRAIGCHESLQHWGDQLCRVIYGVSVFTFDHFGISSEISIDRSRQLYGHLDWLLVLE